MNPLHFLWTLNDKKKDDQDPLSLLRQFSIFKFINRKQAKSLFEHLHFRKLSPNEVFFEKGQSGYALYLITKGQVKIFYQDPNTNPPIAVIGEGEFFGEVALISPDSGRTATVVADTEVECFALFRNDLDEICDEDQELGLFIYRELARVLSQRLLHTINHFLPEKTNEVPPT